jgi:hypothetical protein
LAAGTQSPSPEIRPADDRSPSTGIPQPLADSGSADRLKIEELSDKLIEKREKLEYFIITASTAVIVFSFNDFNKADGVLQGGALWLTMLAWSLLLLAPGFALLAIRRRHGQYAISQEWLRQNRSAPRDDAERSRIERGKLGVKVGDQLMGAFFIGGMAVLALSYSFALLSQT